ncbi:MAG: flavodoxin [Methanoregula sp.]|nr:flavodoxin [Methanoregula sp.]
MNKADPEKTSGLQQVKNRTISGNVLLWKLHGTIHIADNHISEIMTDIVVFVDSRGGNTKKVADAIAEELGIAVGDVKAPVPDDAKILFLGSGTYGGKPGETMMKFIESGNVTGRKVALFGTSSSPAGSENMIAVMADALMKKGATILGNFQCRGKFLLMNRGHPNKEDLDNAKKFAREMLIIR